MFRLFKVPTCLELDLYRTYGGFPLKIKNLFKKWLVYVTRQAKVVSDIFDGQGDGTVGPGVPEEM